MTTPTPVLLFGLGPIGQRIARLAAAREDLRIVGAVDIAPALTGRDLGEVLGLGRTLGVAVRAEPGAAPEGCVALHATGSSLERMAPQFRALLAAGYHVVSTCEELAFPFFHHARVAQALDGHAREVGRVLVGTGVNPGFAMDTLPLALTATSERVDHVRVERRVAAASRREPLQRKIGASLTPEAFEEGVRAGRIRHVGLPESAAAVAAGLGFRVDRIEDTIAPVIATERLTTQFLTVEPGQVAGVHQVARGFEGARERVSLELVMSVSVPASVDRILLKGEPDMALTVEGIHGDTATASITVNAVRSVATARPGLRTMADLALVHR
jgi:4-hydroxy-tetrahydrodipicolinate reductase